MALRRSLPVFVVAALLSGPAVAQEALNGKRLYLDARRIVGSPASCVDCHGGLPGGAFAIGAAANDPARIQRAIDSIPPMAMFRGRLSPAQVADLAAYIGNPGVVSPDVRLGSESSQDRLDFGALPPGQTRVARAWLANTGGLPLTLGSPPRIVGSASSDFTLLSDCREGVLPAGARCAIDIRFQPGTSAPGLRAAALQVDHDWVGGTVALALLGTVESESSVPPVGGSGGGGAVPPLFAAAALVALALRRRSTTPRPSGPGSPH